MAKTNGGSRTDTVVKLVLIFFISLLSFSVGTFVGKQVSDSDYRRAALEGDYNPARDTASVDEGHKGLTDEEIASLAEEFVNAEKEEKIQSTHNDSSTSGKSSGRKPAKDDKAGYKKVTGKEEPAKPSKAASEVAKGQSPVKDAPNKRKPDSVLPSIATSAIGKYTVQVASYMDEGEAKTHAARLKGKGWNAFYIPADIKGRTWFRVSVGLFTSHKSAMAYRSEILRDGDVSAAIVQKVVN